MNHDDPASSDDTTDVEGYVVDLACLRRYPPRDYRQRAQDHTSECALMGHCVESGYALVDESGRPHLLDDNATPHVVRRLSEANPGQGIYLQAQREERDGEMVTTGVREVRRAADGTEERSGDGT